MNPSIDDVNCVHVHEYLCTYDVRKSHDYMLGCYMSMGE